MLEREMRDLVAQMIKDHDPRTVGQLAALLKAHGAFDEERFTETVKQMVRDGSLRLEKPKYPLGSFVGYLRTPSVSSWFWSTIALTAVAVVLAISPSGFLPLDALRWCFGSVFLLFLPGYSCLQLLFTKPGEMRKSQRYILSVPVSLAILIILGLVLNYSNVGIRLDSLLETEGAVIVVLGVAAAIRLYLLNKA